MPPVRLAGLDRPRGVQPALGGRQGRQDAPDARPGPTVLVPTADARRRRGAVPAQDVHALVNTERAAVVVVNTVGHATRGHVRREEKFHDLLGPILEIAQATDTAIVGLMHFPRGGESLGRRLEGLACSVMRLTRPDPEHQPARRKLTATGSFQEPPALGVTFFGDRCEYDTRPPSEPGPARRGRPADKLASAIEFLDEKPAEGPRKAAELIRAWEELGGNEG